MKELKEKMLNFKSALLDLVVAMEQINDYIIEDYPFDKLKIIEWVDSTIEKIDLLRKFPEFIYHNYVMLLYEEMMKGDSKKMNIKDWYIEDYKDDKLGTELKDDITFSGLLNALDDNKDVYEYLGVGDSVIRERVFNKLAEIVGVDYDIIYNKWLNI